ncbi:hypothetical protein CAPTEDRAFT_202245 [Capitella teleta]|uniref:Glutathione S-transferase 3, mitochondrial n=1 Tax=Capitella teleta TaxID=283909 RepID=R7UT15_CAPTE|nr:hypothetical protein CAPTEDRAFT_202245 [Capitella teleta]|eukprot:ELU09634.1 hypothetical protein CAPTEDRAFT_202245 [Capitella teleta]
MAIEILPEFGYCVLVAVGSVFIVQWMGIRVGMARRKFGVKYPTMYSDKDDKFNCVQRAHQNTLEGYPVFLMLLLLGGIPHPTLAAGAGALYQLSRIVYALGYYTGDPSKRNRGAFGYLGLLTLLGCAISLGLKLLGWI